MCRHLMPPSLSANGGYDEYPRTISTVAALLHQHSPGIAQAIGEGLRCTLSCRPLAVKYLHRDKVGVGRTEAWCERTLLIPHIVTKGR